MEAGDFQERARGPGRPDDKKCHLIAPVRATSSRGLTVPGQGPLPLFVRQCTMTLANPKEVPRVPKLLRHHNCTLQQVGKAGTVTRVKVHMRLDQLAFPQE